MKENKRIWLLFESVEARAEAVHILKENCIVLPECGEGFSILKSSLGEIDKILSTSGFDLTKRYVQFM